MAAVHPLPGIARRTAIVTGANHGIGAATAIELAAQGANVIATFLTLHDAPDPGTPDEYRRQRALGGEHVEAAIAAHGAAGLVLEADLGDPASAADLFDRAEARFGPVEILVNNASGWLADTFTAAATDRFGRALSAVSPVTVDRLLAVDARAAALLIAELARRHTARGGTWGRIVGLTSGGPGGFPGEVSYGAAKAAQENYTMSAARELAPYGITANVVYPPVTDTGWVTEEVRAAVEASSEHVHVAHPDDVAAVVAYLVSDLAWLVTGNVIRLR